MNPEIQKLIREVETKTLELRHSPITRRYEHDCKRILLKKKLEELRAQIKKLDTAGDFRFYYQS